MYEIKLLLLDNGGFLNKFWDLWINLGMNSNTV